MRPIAGRNGDNQGFISKLAGSNRKCDVLARQLPGFARTEPVSFDTFQAFCLLPSKVPGFFGPGLSHLRFEPAAEEL